VQELSLPSSRRAFCVPVRHPLLMPCLLLCCCAVLPPPLPLCPRTQNVAIRKVKVLKAPKFDLTKLMDVHGDYTEEVRGANPRQSTSLLFPWSCCTRSSELMRIMSIAWWIQFKPPLRLKRGRAKGLFSCLKPWLGVLTCCAVACCAGACQGGAPS
jgi:hypothetical protein